MLRNQLIRNCSRQIKSVFTSSINKQSRVDHSIVLPKYFKLLTTTTGSVIGGCSLMMYYHTNTQQFEAQSSSKFYELSANNAQTGQAISMSEMRGKVCLIVNVASNCGFTPQYKGLQELQDKYGKEGKFEVIAFPSNSFNQEKGSTEEICAFTKDRFKVTFKIMEKIDVNGANTHPIYQFLKQEGPGGFLGSTNIKWNFTKFLINKEGKVIERYGPTTDPLSIAKDIEKALKD